MEERYSVGPTKSQIERKAYELFLARGGQGGWDLQDWLTAEKELEFESLLAHADTLPRGIARRMADSRSLHGFGDWL